MVVFVLKCHMPVRFALLLMLLPLACRADDLPPVFVKWMENQQKMGRNIQVTFKQERRTPVLKEPVKTEGRFWKMLDGRFRYELGSPATTVMIYDGTKLLLKEGKDAKWETLDPDDKRATVWKRVLGSRSADREALQTNFKSSVTQQEAHFATIALVPRPLLMRKHLKQIDMQIEPEGERMYLLRVIQGDGAVLTIQFEPPQTITGPTAALFSAK